MSSRPFISSFLIGVLLINTVGFLAVYTSLKHVHHFHVDTQLKRSINHKKYERLDVSKVEFEQFRWRRPQKEFERNNTLYDIVSISTSEDSVFIVCYKDKHEMKMDTYFSKVIDVQFSDTSDSERLSTSFLFHPFIRAPFSHPLQLPSDYRPQRKDYFHYLVQLSNPHLTIYSPPPQSLTV